MEKLLVKRVVSGILLGTTVFLSTFNYWSSGLMIALFISLGLVEFFSMLEKRGIYAFKIFGTGVGVLIPLSILLRFKLTVEVQLLFMIIGLILLFILQFLRRSNHQATIGISTTVFGIFYISWCLSFLVRIRQFASGGYLLLGLIIIVKCADSIAYLVGMRWGKSPLITRISPKKTWEGAVAAFVASIVVSILCRNFMEFTLTQALLSGVMIGFLGQLGDLCESLIKRDCGVKDSGGIFPGLGGVLDILDSIIFVAPAFYLFLKIIHF